MSQTYRMLVETRRGQSKSRQILAHASPSVNVEDELDEIDRTLTRFGAFQKDQEEVNVSQTRHDPQRET